MQHFNTNRKYDLNSRFASRKEELLQKVEEIANTTFVDNEDEKAATAQFVELVDSDVEKTIQEDRQEDPNCRDSIQMQLDKSRDRQKDLENQLSDLKDQKAKHLSAVENSSKPWVYMGIYALLLVAMFAAGALTAEILFPEQGRLLPWITSVVFLGGSYLINNLYWGKSEEQRPRFFRLLNQLGLACFLGLALSFALGRAALFLELHRAHAGASLFGQGSENGLLFLLQSVTAISAFVFAVLLELCFGSSLLITINKRLKPQTDLKETEIKIGKVEEDIKAETVSVSNLTAQLKATDESEAYRQAWSKQARSELMADFNLKMAQAKEKALRELMATNRSAIARAALLSKPNPKEGEIP